MPPAVSAWPQNEPETFLSFCPLLNERLTALGKTMSARTRELPEIPGCQRRRTDDDRD
jgi:hypothetical protein